MPIQELLSLIHYIPCDKFAAKAKKYFLTSIENGLLGTIPKSPFSIDFMRQNRLISFLSHELGPSIFIWTIKIHRHSRWYFRCALKALLQAAPQGAFDGLPLAWGMLLATRKRVYIFFERHLIRNLILF